MSQRSKREVAPPTNQTLAVVPWWGAAGKPNTPFPTSGETMAPPSGWWTAQPPHNNLFVPPYAPWMGTVPMPNGHRNLDTSTDSLECASGGFQSLLQNGLNSFPAAHSDPIGQRGASGSKGKTVINIDDGEEARKEKRLSWTPDEDVRLKNDHYWGDVHADYNSTSPPNGKRKVKHLRDRWQKIKRWVGFFCGSWKKATSVFSSGQSEDQLREMALQFYLDDYKEGPFTVMHCWKILKDEPKWLAIQDELENSNKRKLNDDVGAGDNMKEPEDTNEKGRPIGTKEAKKQRMGKGKSKGHDVGLDEDMKKYMDIQAAATKRHEDFIETQQRVSDAKVEEARLRKEAALLESYKALMSMDTSSMDEEMKAEHKLGLRILREKLVGHPN